MSIKMPKRKFVHDLDQFNYQISIQIDDLDIRITTRDQSASLEMVRAAVSKAVLVSGNISRT